jgi:hypothetical protein
MNPFDTLLELISENATDKSCLKGIRATSKLTEIYKGKVSENFMKVAYRVTELCDHKNDEIRAKSMNAVANLAEKAEQQIISLPPEWFAKVDIAIENHVKRYAKRKTL